MITDTEVRYQPFDDDPMADLAKHLDTPYGNPIGLVTLTKVTQKKEGDASFQPPFTDETLAEELAGHALLRNETSIQEERDKLLEALDFRIVHGTAYEPNLTFNTFSTKLDKKLSFYADRHQAKRLETGKHEAAEWGYGLVNGKEVIVFSLDFAFMGGSLNPVVAKLHREAADEAIRLKIPLISDYRTGGARQEENGAALFMMPEITDDVERVKDAGLLTVGIAQNQTWGGIPASAMPRNDFLIAYEGGGLGFAGARVGDKSRDSRVQFGIPPEVAQRAETHAIMRNIEILVQDHDELIDVLDGILEYSKTTEGQKEFITPNLDQSPGRELPITGRHIQSADLGRRALAATRLIRLNPRDFDPKDPLDMYKKVMYDPTLLDTDTFISTLESPVPLYNRFRDRKGNLIYPRLITGLGKIAGQTYLVVGHQPSYVLRGKPGEEEFVRFSPVLGQKDLKLGLRHIDFASRRGIPIIAIGETLGAEASVEAELNEQFRYISDYQHAYRRHSRPVFGVGIVIGSGGGLTGAPRDDELILLDYSHTMVAEAYSSAAITFKIKDREPNPDEVRHTLGALNPYAQHQVDIGIADRVLVGGPNSTVSSFALQRLIYERNKDLGRADSDKLLAMRKERSDRFIDSLVIKNGDS